MNKRNKGSNLSELKKLTKDLNDRDEDIIDSLRKIEDIVNNCDYLDKGIACQIKEIIADIKWMKGKTIGTNIQSSL